MARIFFALMAVVVGAAFSQAADTPSYTKDVKPFITKYCADCHTAKQAKAGFNFDTYAGLTKTGRKGTAVVPSKPEKSKFLLTMTGGGKQMPPKKHPAHPTKEEIEVIRAWIKAGAKDDSAASADR